jgi:hypothetical protein
MNITAESTKEKLVISVAKKDLTCDNNVSEYLDFIRGVLIGLGHSYLEGKEIKIVEPEVF